MSKIGTLTTTNAELQAMLRASVEADAIVLDSTDQGGFGLVIWARPEAGGNVAYIVHRWATKRTDDSPIEGGLFWSGGYYTDERSARVDFNTRPATR